MKETALITGASSGIGLDLARLFAKDGNDVVLVARSEGKLRELAAELERDCGVKAHVIVADLARPDAPRQLVDALTVDVDVLVNNAGFGVTGPFVATDLAKELEMIQVNIVALTELTKLLLPPMVARRRGRVLNVASTAAFQPGPLMAVYYATKAYVLSFSEAVADELRCTAVTVTTLCPGPTATEFNQRGNIRTTRLFKGSTMDAAAVARAGYDGMLRGRRVVIPGLRNRVVAGAAQIAPRKLATRVARKLNEAK